jgi:hypothetical protein
MRIVCLESPFKPSESDIQRYAGRYSPSELLRQNLIYARLLLLNSLKLGEAPFASHLLYTQVWSEREDLRQAGIRSGIEFHNRVDLIVLGVDLGTSTGMKLATDNARLVNTELTTRSILDVSDGQDPRDILAKMELETFPYLEELQRNEEKAAARLKRDSRA